MVHNYSICRDKTGTPLRGAAQSNAVLSRQYSNTSGFPAVIYNFQEKLL